MFTLSSCSEGRTSRHRPRRGWRRSRRQRARRRSCCSLTRCTTQWARCGMTSSPRYVPSLVISGYPCCQTSCSSEWASRSAGRSWSGSLPRPELPERRSALPPPYGTGDSVAFGRGVPRLGSDVIEPHVVKSRDVRPCLAVDSCMGRYVADAEFIGQLLIRQAVRPPCP